MRWESARLVDLAMPTAGSFVDGPFGSDMKASEYEEEGVPIIRLQNVRPNEFLAKDIKFISPQKAAELSRHSYAPGDLVISKLGDPPGNACVVPSSAGEGVIVADVVRFRGNPELIDHRFLSYYLNSALGQQQFLSLARGTTRTRVNLGGIKTIEVPLPPIDEQRRIAAVMDKADVLRRQRQEALRLSEELVRSVFFDMFVDNPDAVNWTPRTVHWMASEAKGSMRTGPFGSQLLHSEFVDRGVAVLGIDNAVKNRFEWGQQRYITPEKYQSLKRYKVFPGDLIITIMGTLGRCAIVPADIPEAINTKHLCCITLDDRKCLPEFLHAALLNHPDVLRQLGVRTKGAVMPGLNMGIIKDLKLPLPPLVLQKAFRDVVSRCAANRTNMERSREATEVLFGSLQQRAFRGELDLSRLILDEAVPLNRIVDEELRSDSTVLPKKVLPKRTPRVLEAPAAIEQALKEQDAIVESGNSIGWSEDYFRYRTLTNKRLSLPFTFAAIWESVQKEMPEADYDTVKKTIFQYVDKGCLRQLFNAKRKKIIFLPRRA